MQTTKTNRLACRSIRLPIVVVVIALVSAGGAFLPSEAKGQSPLTQRMNSDPRVISARQTAAVIAGQWSGEWIVANGYNGKAELSILDFVAKAPSPRERTGRPRFFLKVAIHLEGFGPRWESPRTVLCPFDGIRSFVVDVPPELKVNMVITEAGGLEMTSTSGKFRSTGTEQDRGIQVKLSPVQ